MFAWDSRPERRNGRGRRRPDLAALEGLENRELMAYSPVGMSLPDLVVSGYASPVASWNGPMTVTVTVKNLGASTIVEPLALPIGSTSSADAGPFAVGVYISPSAHNFNHAIRVGAVNISGLGQNNATQVSQLVALPPRFPTFGFPGNGGKIYVFFQVNDTAQVLESNNANNTSPVVPVTIEAPLPELSVVGLDVPPVMQPGDTIQPNIRIANLGPTDTALQGPVTVDLVASTTPTFNAGSSIVATYSITNVPGEVNVSTATSFLGDANQTPQGNVVTIFSDPLTLPKSPRVYYLGVVIDPQHTLNQLSVVGKNRRNPFSLSHKVGPPIKYLPPAGENFAGGVTNIPVFPTAFGGQAVGSATGVLAPTSTTPTLPALPTFPVTPSAVNGVGNLSNPTTSGATPTPASNNTLFSVTNPRRTVLSVLAHGGVALQPSMARPATAAVNSQTGRSTLKSVRLISNF